VTRYLLDTNIVSDATKPRISKALADWLATQADDDLFIATLTIAEIWRGIIEMVSSRRRRELEAWFVSLQGPRTLFRGRILPFDERAAIEWGRIMAEGRPAGRPRSPIDMIIAATAVANDCVLVTGNERHFQGVIEFFNPLRSTD